MEIEKMQSNFLKRGVFLLGLLAASVAGIAQQAYPNRPVKIIVPFAASGPADNYARFMAQRLQEALGQNFVVDNRPGAGSIIGTDAAAKSAPDGYTLLMMSNTQTVNESLIPVRPFNLLKDFVPIAPINYSDLVLVAHPSVPAQNLPELIKYAKANPGKINYASSGNGTPYHMAGELFKYMAGVNMTHIPYKGSAAARTDVLSGQVDVMFDAVTTMTENIKAGKVRGLATTGRTRSTVAPELPTVNDDGVPKYEALIWLGMMAPAGTPDAIVQRLNTEINKIVNSPDVKATWAKQGAVAMSMTAPAFAKYVADDVTKWATIVKASGAKAD
jgi:tripartite-type tricarboxylate transporter receptor subunit TctC